MSAIAESSCWLRSNDIFSRSYLLNLPDGILISDILCVSSILEGRKHTEYGAESCNSPNNEGVSRFESPEATRFDDTADLESQISKYVDEQIEVPRILDNNGLRQKFSSRCSVLAVEDVALHWRADDDYVYGQAPFENDDDNYDVQGLVDCDLLEPLEEAVEDEILETLAGNVLEPTVEEGIILEPLDTLTDGPVEETYEIQDFAYGGMDGAYDDRDENNDDHNNESEQQLSVPKLHRSIELMLLGREKANSLMQTTVTFYYDSGSDCSEVEDYGTSATTADALDRDRQMSRREMKKCMFNSSANDASSKRYFRRALSFHKKTKANKDQDDRRQQHALYSFSQVFHRDLGRWMHERHIVGRPSTLVAYSIDSRAPVLQAIADDSLRLTVALRNKKESGGAVGKHARKSDLIRLANQRVLKHYIQGDGVLIVTSKALVEEWASFYRNVPEARLHVYTESLPNRRRLGAHNLSQFDVVITTFDVAKAKEVAVPEYSSDTDEDGDDDKLLRGEVPALSEEVGSIYDSDDDDREEQHANANTDDLNDDLSDGDDDDIFENPENTTDVNCRGNCDTTEASNSCSITSSRIGGVDSRKPPTVTRKPPPPAAAAAHSKKRSGSSRLLDLRGRRGAAAAGGGSSGSGAVDGSVNSSVQWLATNRKDILIEMSNLHLIKWGRIVLDISDLSNIKPNNVKGVAIRALCGESKTALFEGPPADIIIDNFHHTKRCDDVRELLGISITAPNVDIMFGAR